MERQHNAEVGGDNSLAQDKEGSSLEGRPKRKRMKWPPRSPSPSDEETEYDEEEPSERQPVRRPKDQEWEPGSGLSSGESESEYEITAELEQPKVSERHPNDNTKSVRWSRARGRSQEWRQHCVLSSEHALQKWLEEKEEEMAPARWGKIKTATTSAGFKHMYHCNIEECKAQLLVLFPDGSKHVKLSFNCQDHVHSEDALMRASGLTQKVKKEAILLWESGIRKPDMVKKALREKGIDGYKDEQIVNFVKGLRRKKYMSASVPLAISDMVEWCNERSITQLSAALDGDVDRVYVIDYTANAETQEYHIFLSSKRLVKFAAQAPTLNVEVSHRLNGHDSSFLFLGVSDACGQFFPVLFAVMSETKTNYKRKQTETEAEQTKAAYTQLFKVLKRCVEVASCSEFRPRCVVGDGCAQLTEAAKEVFPGAARRVCWLRAKKDMGAALKREDKAARACFEKDIAALQLSCDKKQFETATQLMLKKWRELWPASAFPEYFEERHVKLNSGWYEGFDIASHSSNQRLASVLNAVKSRHSLRERIPLQRFLDMAFALVREWSVEAGETGELPRSVEPDDALLKETCQLQSLQKTMVEVHSAIYIPAGDRTAATVDEVDAFEGKMKGEAGSFDEFMSAKMSLWKVVDVGNKSDLAHMSCTCPRFCTGKLCEHVLMIGSAYDVFAMPQSVWDTLPDTPDEQRDRGRPNKRKSGLQLTSIDPSVVEYCIEGGLELE